MKKIIYILAVMATTSLYAQSSVDKGLSSIEENNTTLKALRQQVEADKLGNKTGIYLPSPDFDFSYMWGSPAEISDKTDFSVMQTLDFATIAGMRRRVAEGQNSLVEIQYQSDRMAILLQAKQYFLDLIYYNALVRELNIRLEHARIISDGYKDKLNSGDVSMLEYNKVRLNLTAVKGELARVHADRQTVLSELRRLNGGVEISFDDYHYSPISLPSDFDVWFDTAQAKSPVLQYVKQQVELNKQQITLSKGMGLPTLSAGYTMEKVVGEQLQGVAVALNIPLWDNKNRVKQAKAALVAAESREADSRLQFYGQLQNLYQRVTALGVVAAEYRTNITDLNSGSLLKKALDAGEISLLDYIVEMGLYYNSVNQTLEAERDFQKAYAELSSVEL